ncbi:MAG TPA: hypothetical protein VMX76_03170 [Nevskiaceae bacterium]|nr:hypothetical protein [Nevskiaceae bacterium]
MKERCQQESAAETPFQSPAFKKGRKDYQTLNRGEQVTPTLIIDNQERRLDWPGQGFGQPSDYLKRFRGLLFKIEEAERDSRAYRVRIKKENGSTQLQPIQDQTVKKQLFGFGWAALQAKDLPVAYSSLRTICALTEKQVVEQFKILASQNEKAKLYLQQKQEKEAGMVIRFQREKNQPAIHRANQALVALAKMLGPKSKTG